MGSAGPACSASPSAASSRSRSRWYARNMVRRLVLASSAPQGAAGMRGWAPEVIGAIGPAYQPEAYVDVFFTRPPRAGKQASKRSGACMPGPKTGTRPRRGRQERRSVTRSAPGGLPDHARLQRVNAIDVPVFVANGGTDPMILPRYSCLLAGLIPHARVKIYPDSARVLVLASRRVRHRRPGIPHRRQQRHPQAYHNAYPRQRQPATGGGPACLVMAACEARFRSGASAPAACVVSVAPPAAGRRHCRVALSVTGVS